jgi:hypothetical protein
VKGTAGQVQRRDGVWYIDLDNEHGWDRQCVAGTVAHEVAHILMNQRAVELPDKLEDELLADTVAALGGFCRIMLAGKMRKKVRAGFGEVTTTTSRVGYLSVRALEHLVAVHSWFSSPEPMKHGEIPSTSTRVDCAACGQKLQVPLARGLVRTKCQSCSLAQDLNIV